MCYPAYFTGVHKSNKSLRLHTNAGNTTTDKKGYLGSTLFWLGQGSANVVKIKTLNCAIKMEEVYPTIDEGAFIADL